MSNQEVVVQFEMDGHTPEEDRKPDNPDGQETHLGCQGRGSFGNGLLCRTSLLAFLFTRPAFNRRKGVPILQGLLWVW